MQFYNFYRQASTQALDALIQSSPYCMLLTTSEPGRSRLGVFNHLYQNGTFWLHLHRKDEQVDDLRRQPTAVLSLLDFMSVLPSYWIDEAYGGAATSYYRYAECDCDVKILETPESLTAPLQALMDRYQPEKGYAPLDPASPLYDASFKSIVLVEMTPTTWRTKWKIGQNQPREKRLAIAESLRKRGLAGDLRAAGEIQEDLKK